MNYRDIYELTLVTAILQRSTEAERRAVNPELPFRFSGLCTLIQVENRTLVSYSVC